MARPVEDVLARADEFAARFENYDPCTADELPTWAFTAHRDSLRRGLEEGGTGGSAS